MARAYLVSIVAKEQKAGKRILRRRTSGVG